MNSLRNEWYRRELYASESEAYHRPMEEEYSFYTAVKSGDMEFVRKNLTQGDFTNPEGMGVLSKNALTNQKYHFIVTVALITRHCVEGGLELEQAYRLSDFYILKMDSCTTIKAIADLHQDMVLDFTGKMLVLQKMQFFPNRLCSAQIISIAILTNELLSMNSRTTRHYHQAISHASLNKISVFPSAIISARKKLRRLKTFSNTPIIV